MKIFYINLKDRVDRKEHMENMLTNLNLEFERFPAFRLTPEEIKEDYKLFYDKCVSRFKSYINSKDVKLIKRGIGAFGCYMSHLKIHAMMVDKPIKPYIILEDDVIITQKTIDELAELQEELDTWDMIRSMWHTTDKLVKMRGVNSESKHARKTEFVHNAFGGTHFTVFNDATKIFNYLLEENLFSIDAVYCTEFLDVYHKKLDVKIYPFESDIPRYEKS